MGQIQHLSEENFEASLQNGVTLVDFYSDDCGPCKMIAPIIEELADEMGDAAHFAKVDVAKFQKLAVNHQVTSVPTLILYKDGKEVDRLVGIRDKDTLKQFVQSAD